MSAAGSDQQNELDARDLEFLRTALGREPDLVVGVERRCRGGHPTVVRTHPLRQTADGVEPFPTLFWLVCPRLVRRLSQVEAIGWIDLVRTAVAEDPGFRRQLERDHRRCRVERWRGLSRTDRALARAHGYERPLREGGIGGVADFHGVKCLHLHFAFHLARSGAVGAWLAARDIPESCSESDRPTS